MAHAQPQSLPLWRSMLFVPTNVEKFVTSAPSRGADAYILDLEDSIPMAQKAEARIMVRTAAAKGGPRYRGLGRCQCLRIDVAENRRCGPCLRHRRNPR